MVGLAGFEPAASSSRTKRSTKLSHSPLWSGEGRGLDRLGQQGILDICVEGAFLGMSDGEWYVVLVMAYAFHGGRSTWLERAVGAGEALTEWR